MGTKSHRSAGTQFTARGITQGNVLVCPKSGLPIDCVEDLAGVRRLAVDANISAQSIQVEVDLDGMHDGVHIVDPTDGDVLLINPDGSIDVNTEIDAYGGDNIAISSHPNPIFQENADSLTSTAPKVIFAYTSTDDKTRIQKVDCTAGTNCTFVLKIDGVIKRVFRSSPIERNAVFRFEEHRVLLSGQTLIIEAEVERLYKASHPTFVSLEGYIA